MTPHGVFFLCPNEDIYHFVNTPNLGRIFRRPSSLPFHGIQLQFVGFGFLAGQQVLAVDVVIHNQNVRFLVAVISDNNRAGIQPHGLRTVIAPVTGNDLISASIAGADDQRLGNPDVLDAVHEPHQIGCGTVDGVRLAGIWENLCGWDDLNPLLPVGLTLRIRFEQVIVPGQFDAA